MKKAEPRPAEQKQSRPGKPAPFSFTNINLNNYEENLSLAANNIGTKKVTQTPNLELLKNRHAKRMHTMQEEEEGKPLGGRPSRRSDQEQQRKKKQLEISMFRNRIKSDIDMCQLCSGILEEDEHRLNEGHRKERQKLLLLFEQLEHELLEQKKAWLGYLDEKYELELGSIGQLKDFVDKTESNFQRYTQDVNSHYDGILNQITFQCFTDIMQRYFIKLSQYQEKLTTIKNRPTQQIAVSISPSAVSLEDFLAECFSLTNVQQSIAFEEQKGHVRDESGGFKILTEKKGSSDRTPQRSFKQLQKK